MPIIKYIKIMETEMTIIPFDIERAKRIQEGKEKGRIITRDSKNVRIICWDCKDDPYHIIALKYNEETEREECIATKNDGIVSDFSMENDDLLLEVPEHIQYKDGDILMLQCNICPFIYKESNNGFYAWINFENKLTFEYKENWNGIFDIKGYANKEQKLRLINELKNSKEPIAKEYLEKFFGIKNKTIQPFDKVLVKYDKNDVWNAAFFSHVDKEKPYPYITIGGRYYSECIPYNEETKHLAGTKENWRN